MTALQLLFAKMRHIRPGVPAMLWMVLLFLTAAAVLPAQEARRSLFDLEFAPSSRFTPEQERVITESLLLVLQNRIEGVDIILSSNLASPSVSNTPSNTDFNPEDHSSVEDMTAFQQARLNGADSIVFVRFDGGMDDLRTEFRLYDAYLQRDRASFTLNGAVDSRYRNLFGGFWYEAYQELSAMLRPVENRARVEVFGLPGSLLVIPSVSGEEVAHTFNEQGKTVLELPVPAAYEFRIQKEGYFPEIIGRFIDGSSEIDAASRQERLDRLYMEGGLHMLGYPSIEAGGLFLRGRLWAGMQSVVYLAGLSPGLIYGNDNNQAAGSQDLFLSLPLLSGGPAVGFSPRIIPWEIDIQPEFRLLSSLRFMLDDGVYLDPLLPVELNLQSGVYWQAGRHLSFSLGFGLPFYFHIPPFNGGTDFSRELDAPDIYLNSLGNYVFTGILTPYISVRLGL